MKKYYWVGKYESDITHTDFFEGSITYYGRNENNNNAFCANKVRIASNKSSEFLCFIKENMLEIINNNNETRFVFYNQITAHEIINLEYSLKHYIICLNKHQVIEILNNKIYTRKWFGRFVKTPPYMLISKESCRYNIISKDFPGYKYFIIQKNNSSGGKGTFLLNDKNEMLVREKLSEFDLYIVSPFFENSFPVNTHVCITENNHVVFPLSLQILRVVDNTLLYSGADYIGAQKISQKCKDRIYEAAQKITSAISTLGYRGIMGIDFIVCEDNIMFIEINPRFQGSTLALSKSLNDTIFKSLYQIHVDAFQTSNDLDRVIELGKNLNVKYSSTQYRYMKYSEYYHQLYNRIKETKDYYLYEDGYNPDVIPDYTAHLYRVLLKRSIASVSPDQTCVTMESLFDKTELKLPIDNINHLIILKFSLLTQGVILSKRAKEYISNIGKIKNATFDGIDITIFKELTINCPIAIPLVELSPFHIEYDNLNGLQLFFDNKFVSNVKVDIDEINLTKKTSNGIKYSKIGFRTNDRVRIKHFSVCKYKMEGRACKFCKSNHDDPIELSLDDIFEVINSYEKNVQFKHYLIGGASGEIDSEPEKIKKIIKYIRSISNKSIYLMCVPPQNIRYIKEYKELGLNEIAFNIEIYDDNVAKEIMPGKRVDFSLNYYLKVLRECVKYFGNTGNVRSMLIVGLESKKSLMKGIEKLCSIGVSPMLSVLRPRPSTEFNDFIPYNVHLLKEIYDQAQEIASKYHLRLGPNCSQCQNNTLSISNEILELF